MIYRFGCLTFFHKEFSISFLFMTVTSSIFKQKIMKIETYDGYTCTLYSIPVNYGDIQRCKVYICNWQSITFQVHPLPYELLAVSMRRVPC